MIKWNSWQNSYLSCNLQGNVLNMIFCIVKYNTTFDKSIFTAAYIHCMHGKCSGAVCKLRDSTVVAKKVDYRCAMLFVAFQVLLEHFCIKSVKREIPSIMITG